MKLKGTIILIFLGFILFSCKKENNADLLRGKRNNLVGLWSVEFKTKRYDDGVFISENLGMGEREYFQNGKGIHNLNTNYSYEIDWLYQFSPEKVTVVPIEINTSGTFWTSRVYTVIENTTTKHIWYYESTNVTIDNIEVKFERTITLTKK